MRSTDLSRAPAAPDRTLRCAVFTLPRRTLSCLPHPLALPPFVAVARSNSAVLRCRLAVRDALVVTRRHPPPPADMRSNSAVLCSVTPCRPHAPSRPRHTPPQCRPVAHGPAPSSCRRHARVVVSHELTQAALPSLAPRAAVSHTHRKLAPALSFRARALPSPMQCLLIVHLSTCNGYCNTPLM
ncbi:hypothetical protein DENSPDRAFT_426863 [Dentipellis sp. KUC8613]|nr:hypothetical protein DENSPDRAFT_426863 [Dentipellis sp. KUC8613]